MKHAYPTLITIAAWLLAIPALAQEVTHERVIHLDGTTNTRDIGGYPTSGLRTIEWGRIYRSDNLSRLTESDFRRLEEMGLKTVVDLRTDREHDQSPTVWQGDRPPRFFHFPIGDSHNDWFNAQRRMMKQNRFTEEEARAHMMAGYRMIADEGADSFAKLMDLVLDESNWPILIHCTAGKDRAGVAVALIQEAVGVDRETIMQEFLLTNEVSRAEEKSVLLSRQRDTSSGGRKTGKRPSAAAWFPIVGVLPEMLEAFYAEVEEDYGSMDAFFAEIGVEPEARTGLAASLTAEPVVTHPAIRSTAGTPAPRN